MSYDLSISVAGSSDEQPNTAPLEIPSGPDLARLEGLLGRLREFDPSAEIEEDRKQGVLCSFVVVEADKLPYVEVDARSGAISMSSATDEVVLYRTLTAVSGVFDRSGYRLFDHQQGAAIKPSDRFEDFMQQFRSQWDTQEGFERWMRAATGTRPAAPAVRPAPEPKRSSVIPVIVLVLVLLWGLNKLFKAGYF